MVRSGRIAEAGRASPSAGQRIAGGCDIGRETPGSSAASPASAVRGDAAGRRGPSGRRRTVGDGAPPDHDLGQRDARDRARSHETSATRCPGKGIVAARSPDRPRSRSTCVAVGRGDVGFAKRLQFDRLLDSSRQTGDARGPKLTRRSPGGNHRANGGDRAPTGSLLVRICTLTTTPVYVRPTKPATASTAELGVRCVAPRAATKAQRPRPPSAARRRTARRTWRHGLAQHRECRMPAERATVPRTTRRADDQRPRRSARKLVPTAPPPAGLARFPTALDHQSNQQRDAGIERHQVTRPRIEPAASRSETPRRRPSARTRPSAGIGRSARETSALANSEQHERPGHHAGQALRTGYDTQ